MLCYGRRRALRATVVQRPRRAARRRPVPRPAPGRRRRGARRSAGDYEAVIAPFAGGALLPAAYAGARRYRRAFILWASVWAQPRSIAHAAALPATRHIYRHADAVVAYGEHVRGASSPRSAGGTTTCSWRPSRSSPSCSAVPWQPTRRSKRSALATASATGPLVLYVGPAGAREGRRGARSTRGHACGADATLVLIGDGPCAARSRAVRARVARAAAARRAAGRVRRASTGAAALDPHAALSRALGARRATRPCTRAAP